MSWFERSKFERLNGFEGLKTKFTRGAIVPVLAVATTVSLASYEFAKPARAAAPAPAAAAAPLDDNSVSALLSLDNAMETLAARVTPATVNVTVTSKTSPDRGNASEQNDSDNDGDDSNGMQQFFGPFGNQF